MRKFLPILILALILAVPGMARADWSENFDSYASGSALDGQGGWHGWAGDPAATGYVSNAQSLSAPNSVSITGASDMVHEYTGCTSGTWTYTAQQYIPAGFTGISYFILLNTYTNPGPYNWSTQIQFNASSGTVISDSDLTSLPLVTGLWVEIKVEINLTLNQQTIYYNGQVLTTNSWTDAYAPGGGALNIAAVDLFANTGSPIYYDNLSLTQPQATGACCDDLTGNCTITTQVECQFTWLGAGVPCNATTCAPPVPVERASWGQIKSMYH